MAARKKFKLTPLTNRTDPQDRNPSYEPSMDHQPHPPPIAKPLRVGILNFMNYKLIMHFMLTHSYHNYKPIKFCILILAFINFSFRNCIKRTKAQNLIRIYYYRNYIVRLLLFFQWSPTHKKILGLFPMIRGIEQIILF